jgi:hypothetical protein
MNEYTVIFREESDARSNNPDSSVTNIDLIYVLRGQGSVSLAGLSVTQGIVVLEIFS